MIASTVTGSTVIGSTVRIYCSPVPGSTVVGSTLTSGRIYSRPTDGDSLQSNRSCVFRDLPVARELQDGMELLDKR